MGKNIYEPIAIIGMGCRFPGNAGNPGAFWEMLCQGEDAICDVPPDRWDPRRFYNEDPDWPGKTYVKQGGFLQREVGLFDPLFFGISPREAEGMDPQQRLLLEVVWEAIEDAGLIADSLAGSNTGVFVGGFCLDHKLMRLGVLNRELADSHSATSSTMTILANRISHVFDFRGPSITLDTACSSSLVATHLACQSIWNGECNIALSGGVNVMMRPEYPIVMSKGRFLSDHGRCMAFDERAAGYTRGEGAGVVILKPLAEAISDNDAIYAVIHMTGINQDGHTAGISLPNSKAQEDLIRDVYRRAGISADQVAYFEAHGTGTQAGDPAEARAINAVLAKTRANGDKCPIGSVKTNIGHLEAAAGIASLIKAALCLKNRKVPPNLHFEKPNPAIPFANYCIRVPTSLEDLPKNDMAYASVNAFGYGGTNAHVLLRAAPSRKEKPSESRELFDRPLLLPISANSESALKELAGKYSFLLTNLDKDALADTVYSSAKRRSHLDYRLAILAESRDDLVEKLLSFSIGEMAPDIIVKLVCARESAGLVFVYTGMGPQRAGMGRELIEKEPVFARELEKCDAIFKKLSGWSLIDEFMADKDSHMKETRVAQPANFAIQTALTALWKSYGIEPAAVVGHSVGELAAAYVAGALSLEDALTIAYHRSRLQQTLAGKGTMLAVGLPQEKAQALIEDKLDVSIAAVNSLAALTLAGEEKTLREIARELENKGIFNRFLDVEIPYHSPIMEEIEREFSSILAGIYAKDATLPLYSTVYGKQLQGKEWSGPYWWQNVRQPVLFNAAVGSMLDAGFTHFLEVGPHPVLGHSIKECAVAKNREIIAFPSLHRKVPDIVQFRRSLGMLHCMGYPVNWDNLVPNGRFVPLPSYPWQRENYWRETKRSREDRLGSPGHVFFNEDIRAPEPAWQVELNEQFFPYLKDHCVAGNAVFPGAGYIEAGLALHRKIFQAHRCILKSLQFHSLLVCEQKKIQYISTSYNPQTRKYSVYSRIQEDGSPWKVHASGTILADSVFTDPSRVKPEAIKSRCPREIPIVDLYSSLKKRGLVYGEHFRRVKELWAGDEEFLIAIEGHESIKTESDYLIHPTLFDAAFHTVLATVSGGDPFVLVSIDEIRFYDKPGPKCWAHASVTKRSGNSLRVDFIIFDEEGRELVSARNVRYKAIVNPLALAMQNLLYSLKWKESKLKGKSKKNGKWLIFAGNCSPEILDGLNSRDISYSLVAQTKENAKLGGLAQAIEDNDSKRAVEFLADIFSKREYDTVLSLHDGKDSSLNKIVDDTVSSSLLLVEIVTAWQEVCSDRELRIGIVTRDAQVVQEGDSGTGLSGAGLWGLGLLIDNEHPNIHCKSIDIDRYLCAGLIIDEMLSENNDTDIAIRAEKRFTRHLSDFSGDEGKEGRIKIVKTSTPVVVEQVIPGDIDSLVFRETDRRAPEKGEVEIEVHFAALNFKDYLKVSGRISPKVIDNTHFGDCFGIECSGIITAVGEDVGQYSIGDEVVAHMQGCFRSYRTIPANWVIAKAKPLTLKQGPVYTGYLTALYGLKTMARLQKGERILLHGASGGVGIAAVQVARWLGAELFVTAGTDEKRDYLRSLGIKHVMDSRSLRFVDEIKLATDNQGVDVVFGAVSGEALQRSFSLLKPFGRYIEIGKKDIGENNPLLMEEFNKNLSFISIDIDLLLQYHPFVVAKLCREIREMFCQGHFKPMPVKVFPTKEIGDAFSFMGQGEHIGKIVVSMHDQEVSVEPKKHESGKFLANATAIITGGTRGFGLSLAKWLAKKGVGQLALLSRGGAVSKEAKTAIAEIKARGSVVMAPCLDVTDEIRVKGVIEEIEQSRFPLKAIFHGAMVLDDGLLTDMDEGRLRKVLAPKVQGAINLHRFSQNLSLEYFVCFSSISSIIGNRGQANYIVANSFLDAFAWYRRSLGLPATTINWGVFSETGVVARDDNINEMLDKSGITGFSNEQAFDALDYILLQHPGQIGVFDIDWQRWSESNPAAVSSRFKNLTMQRQSGGESGKKQEYLRLLSELEKTERHGYIQAELCKQFSKILKLSEDRLDVQQSVKNLGIDSLITLELSMALKLEFGVLVSPMDFLKEPSISQLATLILGKLEQDIDS